MKKLIPLSVWIIALFCLCGGTLVAQDFSPLEREWDGAEVKWTYNPWRILLLDFIPEPGVSIDGDMFYGFTYITRIRKNRLLNTSEIIYSSFLLPMELGESMMWQGFKQHNLDVRNNYTRFAEFQSDYQETAVGSTLKDFGGDEGWYNWESINRSKGVPRGTIWTFAASLSLRLSGIAMAGVGGVLYALEGPDADQESGSPNPVTLIGAGVGMALSANLVDLLERSIRAAKYRRFAEALGSSEE
jgi:hypothetical protein